MDKSATVAVDAAHGYGDPEESAPDTHAPTSSPVKIAVISDTICPWCYVGKRRLDRAIAELASEGIDVKVTWLPFELNPHMPVAGMNRREYRSAKFGNWERSQALDAQVAAEGASEAIAFRHDLMERTPNTRASHQLIWLAGEIGGPARQGQLVEALFAAYFSHGLDVGDRVVLTEIGTSSGLPRERIDALFDDDEGAGQVLREEMAAISAGVRGVPLAIGDGLQLFSGAQPTPLIVNALRQFADTQSPAPAQAEPVSADAQG